MHTNNIENLVFFFFFFFSLGNLKVPNKDQVAGLTKDLRARSKVPGMIKVSFHKGGGQYYYLLTYPTHNVVV